MPVQPAGIGYAKVAKTFLNGFWEVAIGSGGAPLRQINVVPRLDMKHIAIVIQLLLDVVLKGNYLGWTFEININLPVLDESVDPVGAILEVLLVVYSPATFRPVINPLLTRTSEDVFVLCVRIVRYTPVSIRIIRAKLGYYRRICQALSQRPILGES